MSLGLPAHLEPLSVSRGFARASHTVAFVCIVATIVCLLAIQTALPSLVLWPATVALVPLLLLLALLNRHDTAQYAASYLVIGALSIYWYVLAGTAVMAEPTSTDNFLFTLPKIALLLVGRPGPSARTGVAWSVGGFVLAETATILAGLQNGVSVVIDWGSLGAAAVVVLFITIGGANSSSLRSAKPSLHRAARDEHLADMRVRIEARAAAVLHDTVLGHLAAIASAPEGPLSAELRRQVERDVETLVGQEWLLDSTPVAESPEVENEWKASRFAQVIEECRESGLTIDVSGDRAVLERLTTDRSVAVALAVKQCLVNVGKHSGTDKAEIVLFGSDQEISIMVIDAGVGFVVGSAAADRLGLSKSVHGRIEDVGGSVQVWSTPGRGTSVLLRVPADAASGTSEAGDD